MDSTALHNLFRSDVGDIEAPFFWSGPEIYSYMDTAQKLFCRLQGGIADSSSSTAQIAVVAGQKFAVLSPLVLKIRRVSRLSDGHEVDVLNVENVGTVGAGIDDYGLHMGLRLDDLQGSVRAIVTGMEEGKVRLIQVPEVDDTLELTVYRLPLADITGSSQALEIAAVHHRYLLYGMKQFAYLKEDPETFDRAASDRNGQMFADYCAQSRADRERLEHKPRTIVYGGL